VLNLSKHSNLQSKTEIEQANRSVLMSNTLSAQKVLRQKAPKCNFAPADQLLVKINKIAQYLLQLFNRTKITIGLILRKP